MSAPLTAAVETDAGADLPALLTTGQVATVLAVDPSTVRRWIDDGRLGAVKPGRGYRVPRTELRRFVAACTVNSRPLT